MGTDRNRIGVVAILAAVGVLLAGCVPREPDPTPDEARDTLVDIIHESAEHLDTDDWENDGSPAVFGCDNGKGVKWSY